MRIVMLARDAEETWLDAAVDDPSALSGVLVPLTADTMEAYEVSSLVNSAANSYPEVIARIA